MNSCNRYGKRDAIINKNQINQECLKCNEKELQDYEMKFRKQEDCVQNIFKI